MLSRIAWVVASLLVSSPSSALSPVAVPSPGGTGTRSCHELSNAVSGELEARAMRPALAGFWDRGDNQAAATLITVSTLPALAYLGVRAYEGLAQARANRISAERIAALRREMASKRCFVR